MKLVLPLISPWVPPPPCPSRPSSLCGAAREPWGESWHKCFCSLGPTNHGKTAGPIWHWEDAGWGLERSHQGQSLHGARPSVSRSIIHWCVRASTRCGPGTRLPQRGGNHSLFIVERTEQDPGQRTQAPNPSGPAPTEQKKSWGSQCAAKALAILPGGGSSLRSHSPSQRERRGVHGAGERTSWPAGLGCGLASAACETR